MYMCACVRMCVQVLQELPAKLESTVLCKLTGTQHELYSAAVDRLKEAWHAKNANTGMYVWAWHAKYANTGTYMWVWHVGNIQCLNISALV